MRNALRRGIRAVPLIAFTLACSSLLAAGTASAQVPEGCDPLPAAQPMDFSAPPNLDLFKLGWFIIAARNTTPTLRRCCTRPNNGSRRGRRRWPNRPSFWTSTKRRCPTGAGSYRDQFAYFIQGPCPLDQRSFCGDLQWQRSERAPAIPPTLDLYKSARCQDVAQPCRPVDVFFITGRHAAGEPINGETPTQWTYDNLDKAGYLGLNPDIFTCARKICRSGGGFQDGCAHRDRAEVQRHDHRQCGRSGQRSYRRPCRAHVQSAQSVLFHSVAGIETAISASPAAGPCGWVSIVNGGGRCVWFASRRKSTTQGRQWDALARRKLLWRRPVFLGLLAGSSATALAQSNVTLQIGCYGGAFTDVEQRFVAEPFTARTGIKITWINGNPSDHLAKLIASRGRPASYDIVYLDDDIEAEAVNAGELGKSGAGDLPNLKFLYAQAINKDGFGPALNFYSTGIAYNVEKLKQRASPHPRHRADCGIEACRHVGVPTLENTMGHAFLVAAEHLAGGDESTRPKKASTRSRDRGQSYPGSSPVLDPLLRSGDVWVAPWLNGRTWGLIDRGVPLRFVLPKEGGFSA